MNPAIVAGAASAAKSGASAATSGFAFAMTNPKHVAGAAMILYGVFKAIPVKDFVPLPDFIIGNTSGNKAENALVGAAWVCAGLFLISK